MAAEGGKKLAGGGPLSPELTERLGGRIRGIADPAFFANGVSVVAHAWFGGGADLTPTYPAPDQAAHFHRALKHLCDAHDRAYYPRFKRWCDEYFVNAHRAGERRGVGGVFFDNLRATDRSIDSLFAFADALGRCLPRAYGPIVVRGRELPWGEAERSLQLFRRSRYAEFILLHDRGTRFGLQTSARMDSVLMSMPPMAAWDAAPRSAPGSLEAALQEMLEPRDWSLLPTRKPEQLCCGSAFCACDSGAPVRA